MEEQDCRPHPWFSSSKKHLLGRLPGPPCAAGQAPPHCCALPLAFPCQVPFPLPPKRPARRLLFILQEGVWAATIPRAFHMSPPVYCSGPPCMRLPSPELIPAAAGGSDGAEQGWGPLLALSGGLWDTGSGPIPTHKRPEKVAPISQALKHWSADVSVFCGGLT